MLNNLANFVFPLAAGYLFLILCDFFSYRIEKEAGYHVLFKSLIVGILLFTFSNMVLSEIDLIRSFNTEIIDSIIPIDNAIRIILMFGFACVFALGINRFHDEERSYSKYIEKKGTAIERRIFDGMRLGEPLQISLESRKVYIGFVKSVDFAEMNLGDVTMFPLYSGYRDENTQELKITTSYRFLIDNLLGYGHISEDDYLDIVFRMSDISTVRSFDEHIREYFGLEKDEI